MATPTGQFIGTVEEMGAALKTLWSKLQAHQQSVHELLNANLELRAALHMAQGTAAAPAVIAPVEAPATDETALTFTVEAASDANSVYA